MPNPYLILAQERIAKAWCRGHLTTPLPSGGRAYCAVGALVTLPTPAWSDPTFTAARLALREAAQAQGYLTAAYLNEDPATTHEEVLALYDLALALTQGA